MPEGKVTLPEEIVDITSPGWNSQLGRYFIGQTGELKLGSRFAAWGGIINPTHSGVNLYFDIFTITNFGEQSFNAEIWLNAKPVVRETRFSQIVPANQAISPAPKPKAFMMQADCLEEVPRGGVNIFDRIVPPNSTLVSDSHQGSIIIGPGGSFSILLKSPGREMITATIVLTWWEEQGVKR